MRDVYIVASGVNTPEFSISNEELVATYNQYVNEHPEQELPYSDPAFIEKASGIKSRHAITREGIFDTSRMRPYYPPREDDSICLQAEFGLGSIHTALSKTDITAKQIDGLICACSNHQRAYPAIAVEIQHHLGAKGYAFDMNVACSSATFGIQQAYMSIAQGIRDHMIVVSPELCTSQLNFCDRDSHFIFGDASSAIILSHRPLGEKCFKIRSTQCLTQYSNNIRNNVGFLTICEQETGTPLVPGAFSQQGRKVFKEVVPMACEPITSHCQHEKLTPDDINCFWLHQANINMNQLIVKKLLGDDVPAQRAPTILDTYANTGSPGSIIAFSQHQDHLQKGDFGMICSFGAGYSIGSIFIERI